MQVAVRYYSRSGNTRELARAMAEALGTEAVSVDDPRAKLEGKVDVLLLGGALYAYGLDRHVKDFIASLDPKQVGSAAVFSTTWLSRHSIALLTDGLKARGIKVLPESCYVRGKPDAQDLDRARAFAREAVGPAWNGI